MDESEKALNRVYECLREARRGLERTSWKKTPLPQDIVSEWRKLDEAFHAALDDDLNTAQAIGHVFSQVRIANRLLEDKALRAADGSRQILEELLRRAEDWTARLGLFGEEPRTFLTRQRDCRAHRAHVDIRAVEELLQRRLDARAAKDFAASDQLRDALAAIGVAVRDTPEGQVWDLC